MSLTFGAEKPVQEVTSEIVINGAVVGGIKSSETFAGKDRYHAALRIPGLLGGLLQGFGETQELAVRDALEVGTKDAHVALSFIDDIKKQITD